jgi:hypothetical protein
MRLTKRGEMVLFIAVLVAMATILWGGYQFINHIWYVEGEGYCWGTITHCMKGKL